MRKKRKKKNKERNAVSEAKDQNRKKKSEKGHAEDVSRSTESLVGYRCPGCAVLVQDQEGLNLHCIRKHGRDRCAPENVTFASEDEFYVSVRKFSHRFLFMHGCHIVELYMIFEEWKAKVEQEHREYWKLVENHDSVLTKYFCCPSLKLPLKSGESTLCTSFIKATFSAVVTVRYCLFHFGHSSSVQLTSSNPTDEISYPRLNSLVTLESTYARQVYSLEIPSPLYITLDGNAEGEALESEQIANVRDVSAQNNSGNIRGYRCSLCGFPIYDQVEMNAHCVSQHGNHYEAKSETFAKENDFDQWKAKLEKEQNTCWRLGKIRYYGSVVTKFFFCSSCYAPIRKGKPRICSSFLKATFCGEVAVQYCTSHIGHDQLAENVDSADKEVSCQEPVNMAIPGKPDLYQADRSPELPSPSYIVVTKKEVGSNPNTPKPSTATNFKQVRAVLTKKEIDIPVVLPSPPPAVLPSPPPASKQSKNASCPTATKVRHVPEAQDSWAEILNTALADPSLSSQYKMLLKCLVASNRDLKNVIAMMKSK
ncbi:hypothetical protein Y032_0011g1535 [Ancylostoma ceylanicum]|nr:hypothetical protein Y032_0011g1535 [Ancylostoma ceylanicum]